jgi:hypothetical protein
VSGSAGPLTVVRLFRSVLFFFFFGGVAVAVRAFDDLFDRELFAMSSAPLVMRGVVVVPIVRKTAHHLESDRSQFAG